jgi:hypothetical protein
LIDSDQRQKNTHSLHVEVATLKRSSQLLPCLPGSSQPQVLIDSCVLRWPKFEIKSAVFESNARKTMSDTIADFIFILTVLDQSYSIVNTCNLDCGLFIFYYLYRMEITIEEAMSQAPQGSPYALLRRTFQYVQANGWDTARIFWLLSNRILKPTDRKIKNLFGSLDTNVFRFIKQTQRYSRKATCARANCPHRERLLINTELCVS